MFIDFVVECMSIWSEIVDAFFFKNIHVTTIKQKLIIHKILLNNK